MSNNGDNHTPHADGTWKFDQSVTDNFEVMLESSIPNYLAMRHLVCELGRTFVKPGTNVVDLGASRGGALKPFVGLNNIRDFNTEPFYPIALEVSDPMLAVLRDVFDPEQVQVEKYDLRHIKNEGPFEPNKSSLILSVLTIQFVPVVYRQKIVAAVYDALQPGGAFLFVEKILGSSAKIDAKLIDVYHQHKQANGYSYDDIERKRAALEGSMFPHTATSNEQLLQQAGFHHVDCFYRYLNFAGWLAIK